MLYAKPETKQKPIIKTHTLKNNSYHGQKMHTAIRGEGEEKRSQLEKRPHRGAERCTTPLNYCIQLSYTPHSGGKCATPVKLYN